MKSKRLSALAVTLISVLCLGTGLLNLMGCMAQGQSKSERTKSERTKSEREFQQTTARKNTTLSSDKIRARFDRIDRNRDGVITPDEVSTRREERLFGKIDANGNQQVTLAEVQQYFQANPSNRPGAASPATGNGSAKAQVAPGTVTKLGIPYATHPGVDPNLTSLDIYSPPAAKNAPVVVFVHGGGLMRGDKANVNEKPAFFNGQGYVFVSVNYRLSPKVQIPTHVQDVAQALVWVNKNIGQYGGDPNKIAVSGHSAGAYLASLVSTDGSYLKSLGKPLSMLKGTISIDTAGYDIAQIMQNPSSRAADSYAKLFGNNPATWRQASPITHVAPQKGIPSFLVIYAGVDRRSGEQSKRFVSALTTNGVQAKLSSAPNQSHESVNKTLGSPGNEATAAVDSFLDSIF